jgi:hypothetical protein
MISPALALQLLAPAASAILEADANALSAIKARSDEFVLWDPQPASVVMANQRRAAVATAMRTTIAPRHGWELRTEHLESGAYEWELEPGVVLKLSKTTRESRQEAALAAAGVQTLFDLPRSANASDEVLLVRLEGNAMRLPVIDLAHIDSRGRVRYYIPMQTIAASAVEQITPLAAPRAKVELSGDKKRHAQSPDA